jgi:hypothetical protein
MNRGKGQVTSRLGGYTIVETLIFLAVSAAIFFAAMQLIGGQQGKAQFIDAVRDFETKLTDMANDVSTGYYQGDGSFNCYDSGGGVLKFDGAGTGQGTNEPCIFVGTVIKFGDGTTGSDDERSKFTQFTMAGLRSDSSGLNTTSLVNAKPQVVDASTSYATQTISYGASVQCVGLGSSCVWNSPLYGALGFFTKFVGTDPSGGNGIQTDVLPYMAVPLNTTGQSQMNNISYPTTNYSTGLNPNGGITICLKSATSPQYALVHVGGSGNNLTFSNEIKNYSGVIPCN